MDLVQVVLRDQAVIAGVSVIIAIPGHDVLESSRQNSGVEKEQVVSIDLLADERLVVAQYLELPLDLNLYL